jgi:hypothetical protein
MWLYNDQEFDEDIIGDNIGFVYIIHNLSNNKKYIGKKLFKFSRTKKVKGKKKKTKVESNWKSYYGSNEELLEDVKVLSEQNFKRVILHLCKSKGTANYLEMKEQILHNVLESESYYNQWIMCKVHRSHLKGL